MPTQRKAEIIETIQKDFEESVGIYFTNYSGLDVPQVTQLRDDFRDKSVKYRVSKNTLAKIAAHKAGFTNIDDFFTGQISIAYSKNDPSDPARVIKEFIKKNENLEVVGILFEGERFEADKFNDLAKLPTRDELIAKFISGLSQPMTKLAATLNASMTKLAGTLDSLRKIKV